MCKEEYKRGNTMDKFEMWKSWGDIHNDADQKKRIESAKKAI